MPSPPIPERSDAQAIRAFIANAQAHADQAYAAMREKFPGKFNDNPDEGVTGRALAALDVLAKALKTLTWGEIVSDRDNPGGYKGRVVSVSNAALRRARALVEGNA